MRLVVQRFRVFYFGTLYRIPIHRRMLHCNETVSSSLSFPLAAVAGKTADCGYLSMQRRKNLNFLPFDCIGQVNSGNGSRACRLQTAGADFDF
ncbi:hypothetical protein P6U16_04165 [Rhizobium sp. 32-5/1]|uniref:hypothetical protein n=1 Tax=Rhizobium sp. 32-5/1 TaxID=3019602 RepID=UPI00240E4F94|nr:hypothetical protein [Rhizobium sp. 32-5/1]WEZ83945.1 hypothetical protein P6U16_04165 [Rhizobium sp. 32-5/1]